MDATPTRKVALGHKFGVDLCRALGLDPALVQTIDLRCHVGDVVTVKVGAFVKDGDELASVLSEYVLVEKDS